MVLFNAFTTLTEILSPGQTRPTIELINGQCRLISKKQFERTKEIQSIMRSCCTCVRSLICKQDISKSYERIGMKFSG